MTQHESIIQYLKTHKEGLTMFSGFSELHQTKINTRCAELEKEGYIFDKQWETLNGKRFIRYRLVGEPVNFVEQKTGQLAWV